MKKVLVLFLAVLSLVALTACGEKETTGVGYGLVHKHYVGVVEVTVDKDGVVKSATMEEYFLPYSWGKVVITDTENIPADIYAYTTSRGTSYYAKYLMIGDKLFTRADDGIVYSAEGIADIEEWVKVEANAKWYVDQIDAKKFGFVNADGEKVEYAMADASAKTSMKKSESGYWTVEAPALGWLGNRDAFIKALVGTKLDATLTSENRNDKGFWVIADAVSGVTLVDLPDYYTVAQRAYSNKK